MSTSGSEHACSISEHVCKSSRHTTFYLACGPADGTPLIFLHGWPELSISWRHQLPVFGGLGFRAIAPDMRGYGASSIPNGHADYAIEHTVVDMVELLDAIGDDKAVWVGHDWGTPVVWGLAQHHPDRCHGVAGLCVPYQPGGFSAENAIALADRTVYPEDEFPAAQWDYQLFYRENFEKAQRDFETDVRATVRTLLRAGSAEHMGKPAPTSITRKMGGFFGPGDRAPDMPRDPAVLTEADERHYVEALERNGFFGPDSWYMNAEANTAFSARAPNGGRLSMPVLFLHAEYDTVCETLASRLAEPMRQHCDQLTERVVASGHWMAQEKPLAVNAALAHWLATQPLDLLPLRAP